jgi:16S rRNA (guanine966-N2)-methyltransferase
LPARGAQARTLRIIAGQWRGRRLRFARSAEIRPTPDRVRETLFNWLGSRVVGARCLDLFAGSGALGLEALSRGAAQTVFVEKDQAAARDLTALLSEWNASNARVERKDALQFLQGPVASFELVFLDPPFGSGLLEPVAQLLETRSWLCVDSLIYVEAGAHEPLPALPASWTLLKAKRAGEVGYHLFERAERGPSSK